MQQEEWKELAELARQTLRILPDDTTAKQYLEESKNKKTRIEKAEEIVKKEPTPENYLTLSLRYYREGMYKKCIEACNKALELKPDYTEAYNNICSAYNELSMWDEAIEACEQSLKINPEYQLAKNNLNWAVSEKNKGVK